jgi:endonuclease/exonuclease/phosphatase (EEP) superfamily protein YafD
MSRSKYLTISPKIIKTQLHSLAVLFLALSGMLLALILLLSFLGTWWWKFELLSHFRWQYWLGFLGCAVGLLVLRRPWLATAFLAIVVLTGLTLTPLVSGTLNRVQATQGEGLSIYFANVYIGNNDALAIAEGVEARQPDIVFFSELNSRTFQELVELLPQYPLHHFEPGPTAFQVAVFSKLGPEFEPEILAFFPDESAEPALEVRLLYQDRPVRVIGIHPPPPINEFWVAQRDAQLRALASEIAASKLPTILGGDFNSTPWSYIFEEVISLSGLQDARRFGQLHLSWPTNLPFFMRIPIDHVLVSEEFVVTKLSVEPSVRSDHLPVYVELEWREAVGVK